MNLVGLGWGIILVRNYNYLYILSLSPHCPSPLPLQPQVFKGTGPALPSSPSWHHHSVTPLCPFPAVPTPWRLHAHPDRMPALPTTLHPLLPITTFSFSSCVPALASHSLRRPRLRPAPLQHGGWGSHHEGWGHQRQHAALAGLLGRVHPGQHLEHPQRQRQAEEVEAAGVPHLHTGGHTHPQHGHPHHHVLCRHAAPSALQLRLERGSVQGVCLHLLHSHAGHLLLRHLALLSQDVDGALACKLQVRSFMILVVNFMYMEPITDSFQINDKRTSCSSSHHFIGFICPGLRYLSLWFIFICSPPRIKTFHGFSATKTVL